VFDKCKEGDTPLYQEESGCKAGLKGQEKCTC
jgi:hypothetical protein